MLYKKYFKRLIDLVGSIVFLLLSSWIVVFFMLAYLITLEFPLFFVQYRIGLNGKPFRMLKFRTLLIDEGKSLAERRFRLGSLLRRTNLDELPQLWNVLKGDMSLIGPRPLPVEYASLLSDEQSKRHEVKPGITGWAQVNGRHSISWQQKFELDNYYVRNISFKLDLIILFKTIVLLLSFPKDHSLEEEKFKGN